MFFSRNPLAAFAALSTAYYGYLGFFNPYLPLWLKDQGYSLFAISALVSLQSVSRLLAPYAWGMLSDRTGERVRLLRWVAMIALVSSLGLWLDLGLVALALVLFVAYVHTSAMMPMNEAAMAHLISREGRFDAHRYGRVRIWGSIGFLATVFCAGAWFERFGMGHFPAWTTATLALVALCCWCLPDVKEPHHGPAIAPAVGPLLRKPRVQLFFAALFFHVLAHIGIYVFFSLYLDQLGYSKTVIGFMWAISVLAEIAWFFTQGRWFTAMRPSSWLVVCSAVAVGRLMMTAAWADMFWVLIVVQLTHAVTFAAHHSACIAILAEIFPAKLRGRGQALFTTIGYGLTGVVGGVLGSAMATRWGMASIFWGGAVSSALAVGCALALRRLNPHLLAAKVHRDARG